MIRLATIGAFCVGLSLPALAVAQQSDVPLSALALVFDENGMTSDAIPNADVAIDGFVSTAIEWGIPRDRRRFLLNPAQTTVEDALIALAETAAPDERVLVYIHGAAFSLVGADDVRILTAGTRFDGQFAARLALRRLERGSLPVSRMKEDLLAFGFGQAQVIVAACATDPVDADLRAALDDQIAEVSCPDTITHDGIVFADPAMMDFGIWETLAARDPADLFDDADTLPALFRQAGDPSPETPPAPTAEDPPATADIADEPDTVTSPAPEEALAADDAPAQTDPAPVAAAELAPEAAPEPAPEATPEPAPEPETAEPAPLPVIAGVRETDGDAWRVVWAGLQDAPDCQGLVDFQVQFPQTPVSLMFLPGMITQHCPDGPVPPTPGLTAAPQTAPEPEPASDDPATVTADTVVATDEPAPSDVLPVAERAAEAWQVAWDALQGTTDCTGYRVFMRDHADSLMALLGAPGAIARYCTDEDLAIPLPPRSALPDAPPAEDSAVVLLPPEPEATDAADDTAAPTVTDLRDDLRAISLIIDSFDAPSLPDRSFDAGRRAFDRFVAQMGGDPAAITTAVDAADFAQVLQTDPDAAPVTEVLVYLAGQMAVTAGDNRLWMLPADFDFDTPQRRALPPGDFRDTAFDVTAALSDLSEATGARVLAMIEDCRPPAKPDVPGNIDLWPYIADDSGCARVSGAANVIVFNGQDHSQPDTETGAMLDVLTGIVQDAPDLSLRFVRDRVMVALPDIGNRAVADDLDLLAVARDATGVLDSCLRPVADGDTVTCVDFEGQPVTSPILAALSAPRPETAPPAPPTDPESVLSPRDIAYAAAEGADTCAGWDGFLLAYPDLAEQGDAVARRDRACLLARARAASDLCTVSGDDELTLTRDGTRALQDALLENACWPGVIDGLWGQRTATALDQFVTEALGGATLAGWAGDGRPGCTTLFALQDFDSDAGACTLTCPAGFEISGDTCAPVQVAAPPPAPRPAAPTPSAPRPAAAAPRAQPAPAPAPVARQPAPAPAPAQPCVGFNCPGAGVGTF
ncbi:hypothetical protein SAMN05428995_10418 [Loktanella sp. DSM 29012]|uniref:hypothetical protein n=1 Tax=Loktanella sp. DSM 29012 TaxID=1881056 RepID=UPI0008CA48EC|nr:hypothetical protein [Loktanella sp. DSM 29012]SEQ35955.1 hypothetical protein SAMN05428995_10418 [Loktanella sp. DSM 29012]